MAEPADVLTHKLTEHSRLTAEDAAELEAMTYHRRSLKPGEDFVRQGDRPDVAALVLEGMVARYHLLKGGGRQYLSFHIKGDLPDAQSLFLDQMDHAVCAVGEAELALVPHKEIIRAFERRPSVGFAIWRETLIDAAIFRETITRNSSRNTRTRLAHLFCELFYRARTSGLTDGNSCAAPLSQTQIGEALGMAIVTVNRMLQALRRARLIEFRGGVLTVKDWKRLAVAGDFSPEYLHLKRAVRI
ncbi:Crp/Fnr family transcriptional regulator [Bradyrhizobium lablabi]|uniref:Crp/Fnr family transcriptional regulator n=1 Tax=Bradyrhizobium lablabi TaxID=722472 RepID=UPI001BA70628|nr:Crp/Fnr family transcriptional regulator [Bradyrhizobium lablabi]MBR1125054.1 Crp/Fnr family transcriptional regulator [Bradyrhizobium lablabi]